MFDLEGACGRDPSWTCQRVYDATHNDLVAGGADWLVARPLAIAGIVVGALLISRLARWAIKRSMQRMLGPKSERRIRWLRDKTPGALLHTEEWSLRSDARVQTLTAVFRSIASILIWFVALVWILRILDINFGPLIAGSAIVGVALGFGAQNIVRDFLGGFFLVVEDQFGVGDIVDLGGEARGTVEKITLRSTRLRDVNGTVWHVPNGQIQRVGNKSQEWARALLDIELDIDVDFDTVQRVVLDVATAMAEEADWSFDVLEPPEVWGIENFTAEGYVVRLVVKTRPASQFGVMRELRIRLKAAFDEEGIHFPASHPEMWVHSEPTSVRVPVERRPSGETPAVHPRRGDPSEA